MSNEKSKNQQDVTAQPESKDAKELLYQVITIRDESLLEAFITFDYRVVHPKVGLRFVLYAIVFFTFAWAAGLSGLGAVSLGLGVLCLIIVLIRKNISLMMTKRDDKDYQNRVVYEYDFYENGGMMLREGKLEVPLKNYKKGIRAFYSDQKFYYLIVHDNDIFILPKDRFTVGDSKEFEDFINQKTKLSSIWIPSGMKGVIYRITNFLTKPIIDPSKRPDFSKRGKAKEEDKAEPSGESREAGGKPKTIKRLDRPSGEKSSKSDES